jgi:hypothetical protein
VAFAWRADGPRSPAARAFLAHARTALPAPRAPAAPAASRQSQRGNGMAEKRPSGS